MNDLTVDVLLILNRHVGKGQAIKARELASLLGFKNDRAVRVAIRTLIGQGQPIASSVRGNMGYFIIESHEELKEYLQQLRDRLIEDALRRRDIKLAGNRYLEGVEQRRLV